jgi:hypothetical protein
MGSEKNVKKGSKGCEKFVGDHHQDRMRKDSCFVPGKNLNRNNTDSLLKLCFYRIKDVWIADKGRDRFFGYISQDFNYIILHLIQTGKNSPVRIP